MIGRGVAPPAQKSNCPDHGLKFFGGAEHTLESAKLSQSDRALFAGTTNQPAREQTPALRGNLTHVEAIDFHPGRAGEPLTGFFGDPSSQRLQVNLLSSQAGRAGKCNAEVSGNPDPAYADCWRGWSLGRLPDSPCRAGRERRRKPRPLGREHHRSHRFRHDSCWQVQRRGRNS